MFFIVETQWDKDHVALKQLRTNVFIEEQAVPAALEWDAYDQSALHLLAWNMEAEAIGCARLLDDYKVGRMAVLEAHRGMGVGMALLQAAIQHAQEARWPHIQLSAQTHAIGFYMKAGFVVNSDEYMDAGIPHRDMILYLNDV